MYVSTRCLFPNFSLIWLSVLNKEELCPTTRYPKLTEELIKELKIEKGIEWSMSVFLLECEGKKVLFDAGFFEKDSNSKGILDRLQELKISPDEIDYIFITHFHWDRIAGLIDENDNIIYKNAKIYVSKEEYDGWINKMPAEKNALQVKIMKICEKQVIQFDFKDTLPLGIIPMEAFGHTCFRKDDLIIIGDLIHGEKIQFKYPEICAVFDADENQSIESRKRILKYAEENKLFMAGHHLQFTHFGMCKKYYQNK
jgi:glyoxylase-like metal-dependent hydrolase (beta-lactamase superfamily II)